MNFDFNIDTVLTFVLALTCHLDCAARMPSSLYLCEAHAMHMWYSAAAARKLRQRSPFDKCPSRSSLCRGMGARFCTRPRAGSRTGASPRPGRGRADGRAGAAVTRGQPGAVHDGGRAVRLRHTGIRRQRRRLSGRSPQRRRLHFGVRLEQLWCAVGAPSV